MKDSTRIFGTKTKKDWIDLRVLLLKDLNNESTWSEVCNLLYLRLNTRYFRPIERILKMRITTGEGFAVMTLICSLIEFLESCYQGKNYMFGLKEKEFEYSDSREKFKEFLLNHEPFKSDFSKKVKYPKKKIENFADDFYAYVRCGLLHEASTKNGWIIKTHRKKTDNLKYVIIKDDSTKIIYRDLFFDEIKKYLDNYLEIIKDGENHNSLNLKKNLCRKIDFLCEIKDEAIWWNNN